MHHQHRAGDVLGRARQGEAARLLARLGAVLGAEGELQNIQQHVRRGVPEARHIEITAERDAGLDARVVGGDPRRGIAAHAAAPDAEARGVQLGAFFQHVEHGADRRLEIGAQLHLLPGHALARPVEGAGGEPALEELVLQGEELFLGRIGAGVEQHARHLGAAAIFRQAQIAGKFDRLEGDRDALGRRPHMGHGLEIGLALAGLHAQLLGRVLHIARLAGVKRNGGAEKSLAGANGVAGGQRRVAALLVALARRLPAARPVGDFLHVGDHLYRVVVIDAGPDEPRQAADQMLACAVVGHGSLPGVLGGDVSTGIGRK